MGSLKNGKEDENCFKSRLKCDKRLRRLKINKAPRITKRRECKEGPRVCTAMSSVQRFNKFDLGQKLSINMKL